MRERWGIEARAQIPPPYPGGLYFPESFGPPPPEDQFGHEEYERWHATYREWTRSLEAVYDAAVPEAARYSRYFAGCGWDLFISMCVLYDPPETELVKVADHIQWLHSNVAPRGGRVGDALPITWQRDADEVERAVVEFCKAYIEAVVEKYVHPQGVSSEDVHRSIREERPELFSRFVGDLCAIESRPYIDVQPHTRQQDIEAAGIMLRESHAASPSPGHRRDPLVALQCAVLYDCHNGSNAEDGRERAYTHKRLAEMFALRSPRAAKGHIELGREILREN